MDLKSLPAGIRLAFASVILIIVSYRKFFTERDLDVGYVGIWLNWGRFRSADAMGIPRIECLIIDIARSSATIPLPAEYCRKDANNCQ